MKEMEIRKTSKLNAAEKVEIAKKAETAGEENVKEAEMPENEKVMQEVKRQMGIILKGADQVVSEEELRSKIERSVRTGKPLNIKLGLDPSAPDIHLGHAVVLRKIRQMQDLGHHAIIIIGDFTGRIGDPTGKAKGRKALSDREVLENAQTYKEQIFRVLDPEKTEVRFNGEWLELLNLEQVLRLASTITVARMLERDDFQNRYTHNTPIGLHEFFYPLMQAYDSVAIEADLELGGTDQTFNILMGRSLQKEQGMEPQVALFMPILEGLDGVEKMSKSLGNYIGVNEKAQVMFKKAMEIPDKLIIRYFELATDILPEDLNKIKERLAEGCNPMKIKKELAETITLLYHTKEETEAAKQFYEEAFSHKTIPTDIPTVEIQAQGDRLQDILKPLVQQKAVGQIKSVNELRRLISQGGFKINGDRAEDLEQRINTGDVLQIGKKTFLKLKM